jgi:hypothetical protein
MRRLLLAAKAEVVLGAHLVMRHRTPRLAALLLLVVVLSTILRSPATDVTERGSWNLMLVCGTLAAVAGSRVMAPGAALSAAYHVAAQWWLVPGGRLAGALLVALPIVGVTAVAVGPSQGHGGEATSVLLASCLYTGAVASTVMAATPVTGSSAAATIGLLMAWFGGLRPSAVYLTLEAVPFIQRPLVFLWNVMPLNWRAVRWIEHGISADGLVLGSWLLAGLCAAGWVMPTMYRLQGHAKGTGS